MKLVMGLIVLFSNWWSSFAAADAPSPMVIAYGVSVAEYMPSLFAKYEAKTGQKVSALRNEGISSDSLAIAVDIGRAEIGISGNNWKNIEELLHEKKMPLKNAEKIKHSAAGNDSVVFFVYPGGPRTLSVDQLKGILTGRILNWKAVGGEDIPIQLVLSENTPATQRTIAKELLGGAEIERKGARTVPTFAAAISAVSTTKGAISFGNSFLDFGKATVLENPRIKREITTITLGEPTNRAAQFIAILREMLEAKSRSLAK